jgi:hypothetical protein
MNCHLEPPWLGASKQRAAFLLALAAEERHSLDTEMTDERRGTNRLALIVVIAPVVAVMAIALLLYYSSP